MTRRATVWNVCDSGLSNPWHVDTCHERDYQAWQTIEVRCYLGKGYVTQSFPTHAEALAWALEQVGLAPKAAS